MIGTAASPAGHGRLTRLQRRGIRDVRFSRRSNQEGRSIGKSPDAHRAGTRGRNGPARGHREVHGDGRPDLPGQDRQDPVPGLAEADRRASSAARSPRPERRHSGAAGPAARRSPVSALGSELRARRRGCDRPVRRRRSPVTSRRGGEKMEAQAAAAERRRHRLEDARRPSDARRREARAPARAALQGPGDGRVGRRLLPGARARPSRSSRSASRTSASSRATRSAILSNTRPEWTYSDFAILCAGATVVPDLPDELARGVPVRARALRVQGGDRRGRRAAREDPQGPRPAAQPRARDLDRADRRRRRDHAATRCASAAASRSRRGLRARVAAVEPSDVATYIYTSGTTGPPKGCVIDHANWRFMLDMAEEDGRPRGGGGRLPLPAARARVRAPDPAALGRRRRDDRLLGEGPAEDHSQPGRGQADLLPERPADLREDLRDGSASREARPIKRAIFD